MNELEYLRRESMQCSNNYNTQAQNTIRNVLFMWGGVVVLLSSPYYKNITGNVFLAFIMFSIFFISVLTLYILTQRNKINANYMFKIAMYITAFYEKKPCVKNESDGKNESRENNLWELVNFEQSWEDKDKKELWQFNSPYFMFSLIAVVMEIVFFVIIVINYLPKMNILNFLFVLLCFTLMLISIYLLCKTYDNSMLWAPHKSFEDKKKHLKYFIEYAIKKERYTREMAFERFGDDFLNRVGVSKT